MTLSPSAVEAELVLPPLPSFQGVNGPVVLCVMDGVGWGRRDDGDAVFTAVTPNLDRLMASYPFCFLKAHGTAVGLPSDADMGNSEVGHNALGSGRVFSQGAKLVDAAIATGALFTTPVWRAITSRHTLHLIGLVSDGNVHSHVDQLQALIRGAARDGIPRLRLHVLTDGRDVPGRSALTFIQPLQALLDTLSADGRDYRIASGGGRMLITMDRYEADWGMVQRGWDCHVHGVGRPFAGASEAVETLYAEDPAITDQFLPAFVIVEQEGARRGEPVGLVCDGDAVVFFNFRGDRGGEISRVFEDRLLPDDFRRSSATGRPAPAVYYAGMMQYDGDLKLPANFLVPPPALNRTVSDYLAVNRIPSFAVSETQKFGHVTYFYNGNRSEPRDPSLEQWLEIPSDPGDFDHHPAMKAPEIAAAVVEAMESGRYRQLRVNFANGDMVGHTGDFAATVAAVEAVDAAVGQIAAAVERLDGVLLLTADHGNADQMYEVDKKTGAYAVTADGERKVRTSHSLNPVPFILVDPRRRFALNSAVLQPGLANLGAAILVTSGLTPPEDYLPSLVVTAP